ncbi:putative ABC transport system ATP-binding protein [Amycolatopsis sulphurea]|uniref:Putative ABC transport system ATP-binding protein n=1 Tax=Amycolatopsis sulphurea TaxID=76022 RepID=A0A2A9F7E1_9PSEU|nr:putative ABC transport system ATP-binding protein [Amycolatopsis sulphurea]
MQHRNSGLQAGRTGPQAGVRDAPAPDHGAVIHTNLSSPPQATTTATVRARGVRKSYGTGPGLVEALRGVDVSFHPRMFTALMGPSGSGKSTLLHCLAGLDSVTSGSVEIHGTKLEQLNDAGLTALRRDRIGFIFQSFNLLPTLTARENILLPLEIAGKPVDERLFDHVVRIVGLTDRLGHRPSEMSGGQQQRVAVARAMIARPEVIFADEPTGNLDSVSRTDVLRFLQASVRELGQMIVMVTHDPFAAACADRVVFLRDGLVAGELLRPTEEQVLDTMKALGRAVRR